MSTGGQDAVAAEVDDRFECVGQRGRVIKGSMKGYLEWASCIYQLLRDVSIHNRLGCEDTENDTGRSESLDVVNIVQHDLDLSVGIAEVTTAWTDQDMDRERGEAHSLGDETVTRRQAAFAESRAEFDSVCAAVHGGNAGHDRVGAEFEDDGTDGLAPARYYLRF